MRIALLGASGRIGQRITMEALARGHTVVALAREPERFHVTQPNMTVTQVDIFDPASVAEAIRGADVVVNATGAHGEEPGPFYVNSTRAVIEGIERAGANQRLIVVGGAGSLEVAPGVQLADTPTFPAAAHPTAVAQRETLDMLRASAINWTFFSPSATIAPGRRTGKYRAGTDQLLYNEQGQSVISMEDYAVALLDEIEHPRHIRQRFTAVSLES